VSPVAPRSGLTLARCGPPSPFASTRHTLDQLLALKDLLGHARLETMLVYLRRRKKQLAMERVRDLSWGSVGGFVLQPNAGEAHTGFEPVLPENVGRRRHSGAGVALLLVAS
jgi:hypothetical protein